MVGRLVQVLKHLGIERAHFAGSMLADMTGLVELHPERIASLTLVCPPRLDPGPLRALGSPARLAERSPKKRSARTQNGQPAWHRVSHLTRISPCLRS